MQHKRSTCNRQNQKELRGQLAFTSIKAIRLMNWIRQPNYNSVHFFQTMVSYHLLQPAHKSETKNWIHKNFPDQGSLVSVVLAGSRSKQQPGRLFHSTSWHRWDEHCSRREQERKNGSSQKEGWQKKKTLVKLPWRVIFSWQYLHILPYALQVYHDCTHHRAGPHQVSKWWPRTSSAGTTTCPEKQLFHTSIYIFTGLSLFHCH